jgi:hypothetical protein
MRQVSHEAVMLQEVLAERLQDLQTQLLLRSAVATDQVLMDTAIGAMVLRYAVVKMGVGQDVELLKQLEGAIDGGNVDLWKAGRHSTMDRLCRKMPVYILDGLEHELALGRHALPTVSK